MTDNRIGFLQYVLGDEAEGFLAIGHKHFQTGDWTEQLFNWPTDVEGIEKYIRKQVILGDLYFCPTILDGPRRVKANVKVSEVLWADLDECHPRFLQVPATVVIETSPGRWQAFWKLERRSAAIEVERYNRRIAYAHADEGADKSGWDLTQYLRVPGSQNFKRDRPVTIQVVEFEPDRVYTLEDFNVYPSLKQVEADVIPFPVRLPDKTGAQLLDEIRTTINPRVWQLFESQPDKDWSHSLWQLQLMLFDIGCTREEVYIVARDSACNKYARDGRDDELLWREVCRAYDHVQNRMLASLELNEAAPEFQIPDYELLTKSEKEQARAYRTIIDQYYDWAGTVGDAAPQYHVAGAFTLVSSLIASAVRLPTSYGKVLPNLWFMLLADTTLTRKTTAMDIAMDIAVEIDPDIILATDGSIEGLLTTISMRPNRASVFLRDEFSGLLEMMGKKDYYAGMLEAFTKLYDGKYQKRVLRKEVIELRDPVLVLFAGGIKTRILEQLGPEHINSGFMPRFCIITAESDITRVRPLGPPTGESESGRDEIVDRCRVLYHHYFPPVVDSSNVFPKEWKVTLTDDAWIRYNKLENDMLQIGLDSSVPDLMTPTMSRLCTSGLKAAVLIAASQRLEDEVVVTELDLLKAFSYVEVWKTHAITVVMNAGKTAGERQLERIYKAIQNSGDKGMLRSELMQRYWLNARDATAIFDTLEQRGLVRADKANGTTYFATHRKVKVNKND